jgi:hypothetical protein
MTRPTPQAIAAALAALDEESALWTVQNNRLQHVANRTNGLLIEPGGGALNIDDFLAVYNDAARRYTDLCTGGRDVAAEISRTLAAVRATYADEEKANLHAQQRLY